MKYCENCGTQIEGCDEFCTECGFKQEEQQEDSANKFCEECGEEIEKGDSFCSNCGDIINNYADEKSYVNEENADGLKIPSVAGINIIKIVFVIILAIAIVSLCVFGYFYFNGKNVNNNDIAIEPITEPITSTTTEESVKEESVTGESATEESATEESVTESTKPTVDVSDYLGYWYMNGMDDRELTIYNIIGDKVEFTLWYFRLASIDNVIATLDGNIASFSFLDNTGVGVIKGMLIFGDYSITVKITESEFAYMPVETMIFDSQHYQSWEYYGYETGDTEEKNDYYIISDSDSRYLTEEDLIGKTAYELLIARNEIYARKGRGFQDSSIQAYFDSQSWYIQIYSAEEFNALGSALLNDYEYQNILTIRNYETEQGY